MATTVAALRPAWRAWRPGFARPYRYFALRYKRTWRGTLTSGIGYPVLYLLAMGLGLGHLVNHHLDSVGATNRLGGVGYVEFLAPGLLSASAMQWAANESMYPVMGGLKWLKTYHALIATPVTVTDVLCGHLAWVATRVAGSGALFLCVLALFGDVPSAWALAALPAAVLTGLAFAGPVTAFTASQENGDGLSLMYRVCIVPLFLFSGTFFPISELPGWLQLVARFTPLYHGVALSRSLVLGRVPLADSLGHVVYLLGLFGVGALLARRAFLKRLVV